VDRLVYAVDYVDSCQKHITVELPLQLEQDRRDQVLRQSSATLVRLVLTKVWREHQRTGQRPLRVHWMG